MDPFDFIVTQEFAERYEDGAESTRRTVDGLIRRLLVEHRTLWDRQGRVVGPADRAWIVSTGAPDCEVSVYWDYEGADTIGLIALLVRL